MKANSEASAGLSSSSDRQSSEKRSSFQERSSSQERFGAILPGSTIGILGGGQLGRMVALDARKMGFRILTLDPTPDSPCGQVADKQVVASFTDAEAAKEFANACDVVLYEFEDVDDAVVEVLESSVPVPQGSHLLTITRHRLREKAALVEAGVPVTKHRAVDTWEDFSQAATMVGLPFILKTTTGGYDGKGQWKVGPEDDLETLWAKIDSSRPPIADGPAFIAEAFVPFVMEASVIVARSTNGEVKAFPLVENVHRHHILHLTMYPPRVTDEVAQRAVEIAMTVAQSVSLVGLLAVEMFVLADGTILVNELAPRPHNSGHLTMDACTTPQFEQLVRSILGLPLGDTEYLTPGVMVNVLGEHLEAVQRMFPKLPSNMKLHLYGKAEAKPKRKMGHLNVIAPSVEEALADIGRLGIWDV